MSSSLPTHSLPPLAWLRAFEAVGRHLSFKDAAAELNVSPSTISHQVRSLESHLGIPLFSRGSNGVRLTEEGGRYLGPVQQGFDLLRSADALPSRDSARIRIGTFPFLSTEVLAPNIDSLARAIGVSSISLSAETDRRSLLTPRHEDRLDVLIRYGPKVGAEKSFQGLVIDKLFDITIMPMMAADLPAPQTIDELRALPIVRTRGPFKAWDVWARHFDTTSPINFAMETDSFHAAATAVSRGQGVCLGMMPHMQPWVEDRRIQLLEKFSCDVDESAYVVYAPHNESNTSIARLSEWLRETLT